MPKILNAHAFTLLELLVTMTIIAILTMFAIPRYQEYKRRAFDLRAQYDLQNAAQAEEVYYLDHERYLSCKDSGCTRLPGIARLSPGVTLLIEGNEDWFQAQASHSRGSGKIFQYHSDRGGITVQ